MYRYASYTTYPNHGSEGEGWNSVGELEYVFEGDRVYVASASGGVAGQRRQQLSRFVATNGEDVRVVFTPGQVHRTHEGTDRGDEQCPRRA